WANQDKFPVAVIEEVLKEKEAYGNKEFIVGYRLSPEEAEYPGITMEITEELDNKIINIPIDNIHVSMMDTHATTRE
ncbi:NADH-dependent flavin oxidoreductase, partial [Staphylococcus aureus]|nr:NADH-dependent flavin oxidoreductase [Staphylococcus aureus]